MKPRDALGPAGLSILVLAMGACTGCGDNLPAGAVDGDSGGQPARDADVGDAAPGEADGLLAGGEDGTVFDAGRNAYSHPLPGLSTDEERGFFRGRALFRDDWVQAPASTQTRDGLGPLFNARSCVACHVRDGRGRPPIDDESLVSLLFRLSVPGAGENGAPLPEATYGGQLQPFSVPGVAADGDVQIEYEAVPGSYGDGEEYSLRRPRYQLVGLGYGDASDEVLISPRVAPAMHGLGLLSAVPEATIVALADEDDSDGDGISGRANYVWDQERGQVALGRFGWKANQPSLLQQTAGAFNGDLGITSRLFPSDDCTAAQPGCAEATSGGDPELIDGFLEDVALYTRTLAVPARRALDSAEVRAGQELFSEFGCASCHTPRLQTGESDIDALADQTIYPYTDLLLHDMGPELADDRPDFLADGREWRTAPLWGIGLVEAVNSHQFFLHDGRARGLAEAILWHGGEAEPARERFRTAPAVERAQLIAFLESL
ncbi:MAG: di-heme oxidoredictase family protein [Haliangiales bacterium]